MLGGDQPLSAVSMSARKEAAFGNLEEALEKDPRNRKEWAERKGEEADTRISLTEFMARNASNKS